MQENLELTVIFVLIDFFCISKMIIHLLPMSVLGHVSGFILNTVYSYIYDRLQHVSELSVNLIY